MFSWSFMIMTKNDRYKVILIHFHKYVTTKVVKYAFWLQWRYDLVVAYLYACFPEYMLGFAVWVDDDAWSIMLCLHLFVDEVSLMIIYFWHYCLGLTNYGMEFCLVMMLFCDNLCLFYWPVMIWVCDWFCGTVIHI